MHSDTVLAHEADAAPTLRESKGRRPKNRSLNKGADSKLPGWQPKEKATLTAKAGYDCLNNATEEICPEAVGWAQRRHRAMLDRAEGAATPEPTRRQSWLTQNSPAGNPKRKRPNCHKNVNSRNSVGGISAQKGGDPRTPLRKK